MSVFCQISSEELRHSYVKARCTGYETATTVNSTPLNKHELWMSDDAYRWVGNRNAGYILRKATFLAESRHLHGYLQQNKPWPLSKQRSDMVAFFFARKQRHTTTCAFMPFSAGVGLGRAGAIRLCVLISWCQRAAVAVLLKALISNLGGLSKGEKGIRLCKYTRNYKIQYFKNWEVM